MRNDNDDADYAEEAGRLRWERRMERMMTARDPFYLPELHEQDVRGWSGIDDDDRDGD